MYIVVKKYKIGIDKQNFQTNIFINKEIKQFPRKNQLIRSNFINHYDKHLNYFLFYQQMVLNRLLDVYPSNHIF